VGFAFEFERHPLGEEGPEALAGRALELDVDRLVTKARMTVALGDLTREHGAGRPVRVADGEVEPDMLAALDGVRGFSDEAPVEDAVDLVVLIHAAIDRIARPRVRLQEQLREVEALRLG